MTYFRVQLAHRDLNELLDPGYQFSRPYNGGPASEGVSVCDDLDDLAMYLASPMSAAIDVRSGDWVIVELEADVIPGARPLDPEFESLVRPTRIVRVWPVCPAFIGAIDAYARGFEELSSRSDFED